MNNSINSVSFKYLKIKWEVGYFNFHDNETYIRSNKLITSWTLPYHFDAKEKAKKLRKNMTIYEKKIRKKYLQKLPIIVNRQKPIDHFIADFYIASSKLIIEIDWWIHDKNKDYDKWRDEILSMYWIVIVRIKNKDIENNFDEVKKELDLIIKMTKKIKLQLNKKTNKM